ncbi:MAG: DUF86 domain-containing protein [Leptospirales bacterium]|nr:DUF86 domain-containing protein [Leptospirales bacterium]
MPIDVAVVQRLLAVVRKNHRIVAHYRDLPRLELAAEPGRMLAIQHGLQLAIQALIDLALHIASAAGAARLERYRDAVRALSEEKIVSPEAGERLQAMVGLRNILVHGYTDVDEVRLLELVDQRLDDFITVANQIEEALKSRGLL